MKDKKKYLPYILAAGVIGVLLLASFPPKRFEAQEPASNPQQPQPSGPQPDVGETVLVPKKKTQPAPTQPTPDQPAAAQPSTTKPEKINPNDIYTLSTSANLVNVDVMVVDNSGSPIENLEKKNFKLYDDGVPQAVTNFGTGDAPMTVCLLVEFSSRWWPFLYVALRYSYDFLNVIHPKDWVAVVSFDMKTQILTDFTQDRSEVRGALDQLRIPGFSEYNFYDALNFVLDRMKEVHGRKAVIPIVTGLDSFSKLTYDQTLKIVRASDTPVYPISILEFSLCAAAPVVVFRAASPRVRFTLSTFYRLKMRSRPWPPTPVARPISPALSRMCPACTSKSRISFAPNTAWGLFPPTILEMGSFTNLRLPSWTSREIPWRF